MILIQHIQAQERHLKRVEETVDGRQQVMLAKNFSAVPDLSQVDILFTFGKDMSFQTLQQMTNLKWIQLCSTGFDHLPKEYIQNNGIIVTTAKGAHSEPIAEYTFSMMLYFARKMGHFLELQKKKEWNRLDFPGELAGQTLVILGMGHLGTEIAKKARAFNMNTVGINRSGLSGENFDYVYRINQIEEVLPIADYLILALPLTDQTYHIIGLEQLSMLKPSAVVINVGRGELMDESAAIELLQTNRIRGMALDVFHQEPLPKNSPLWDLPGLMITPHMAALTDHFLDRSIERFVKNYQLYVKGEKMIDVADFTKGY